MFSMQCKFFYDQHLGYKTFKIFNFILKTTLLNIINYLINWKTLIFWLMRNTFAAKPFWGFFNTKAFRISRWIWYMYWACLFQKPDIQSVQLKDTKISPPVQVAVVGSRYPSLGAFWLVLSLAWSYSHKHQHQFIHFTQTSGVQHHSHTTCINTYIISLLVNNCLLWKNVNDLWSMLKNCTFAQRQTYHILFVWTLTTFSVLVHFVWRFWMKCITPFYHLICMKSPLIPRESVNTEHKLTHTVSPAKMKRLTELTMAVSFAFFPAF